MPEHIALFGFIAIEVGAIVSEELDEEVTTRPLAAPRARALAWRTCYVCWTLVPAHTLRSGRPARVCSGCARTGRGTTQDLISPHCACCSSPTCWPGQPSCAGCRWSPC